MFEIVSLEYKSDHVTITLDTGESIKFPFDLYKLYKLETGKKLDRTEYLQLKEESERFECNRKAVNYLSIRSRSSREMENYLIKKGFSKDIIINILKELRDTGYLNDLDFAKRYITSKKKRKTIGKNLLRKELLGKGVSRDTINRALKETSFDHDDITEIYTLATKKLTSLEKKTNKKSKLIYFLHQRGFDNDVIYTVIEQLENDGFEL